MEVYEKNIREVLKIIRDKKKFIEQMNCVTCKQEDAYIDENGILQRSYAGQYYAMSSMNVQQEIQWYLRGIDLNKDNLWIIYGIGNVDLLKYVVQHSSAGSRILILESDLVVTKYCLENFDYTFLSECGKCIMVCGEVFDEFLQKELYMVAELEWENLVYNIQVLMNPNYHDRAEYLEKCVQHIREILISRIRNYGNSLSDMFDGFSNNCLNIREYLYSNRISEIAGKFKGYPAFIIASGPSLEKNIHHLKSANGKALLIACDASVDACVQQGIKLDAVASIERVLATYRNYYKDHTFDKDMVLIGPTNLWPNILKEYQGKKIILSRLDEGADRIILDNYEQIEHYNIGISSAHVAFQTAVEAGCNPIVLVGQDLAFTDDKIHSDSTHTKYEGANNDRKFDGSYVEDVTGNLVKTNDIYNWFRNWFEMQCIVQADRRIIDATEGGARIKGTELMTLKEAVEQFCTKEKKALMKDYLEDIPHNPQEEQEHYKRVSEYLTVEIEKLRGIQNTAQKYYQKLEGIYDKNIDKMNEKQLVQAVREMEQGNKIISEILKDKKIHVYFRNIIKQTVAKVKALGNELNADTVTMNLKLQGTLMGMIMRSVDPIVEKYQGMRSYVDKLIEK